MTSALLERSVIHLRLNELLGMRKTKPGNATSPETVNRDELAMKLHGSKVRDVFHK